jgi:hypothetical protein
MYALLLLRLLFWFRSFSDSLVFGAVTGADNGDDLSMIQGPVWDSGRSRDAVLKLALDRPDSGQFLRQTILSSKRRVLHAPFDTRVVTLRHLTYPLDEDNTPAGRQGLHLEDSACRSAPLPAEWA